VSAARAVIKKNLTSDSDDNQYPAGIHRGKGGAIFEWCSINSGANSHTDEKNHSANYRKVECFFKDLAIVKIHCCNPVDAE
jgi:hypothetical protein